MITRVRCVSALEAYPDSVAPEFLIVYAFRSEH